MTFSKVCLNPHGGSVYLRGGQSAGIDQETFRVMWDQSAPGGEAEGCFLRVPQTEYDAEEFTGTKHPRGWMPDVCTTFNSSFTT